MKPLYVFGLDLGELKDYTALCVIEAIGTPYRPADEEDGLPAAFASWRDEPDEVPDDEFVGPPITLNLRWLERFELMTRYPKIVRSVEERVRKVKGGDVLLSVDATGVGRPVVDLFAEQGLPSINVTITGGKGVVLDAEQPSEVSVPKRELVHGLLVALQQQRFHASNKLPFAKELTEELTNFRMKVTAKGNETYEAWREGDHDDLVLSVAIAAWVAEQEILARLDQALGARKAAEIARVSRVKISAY